MKLFLSPLRRLSDKFRRSSCQSRQLSPRSECLKSLLARVGGYISKFRIRTGRFASKLLLFTSEQKAWASTWLATFHKWKCRLFVRLTLCKVDLITNSSPSLSTNTGLWRSLNGTFTSISLCHRIASDSTSTCWCSSRFSLRLGTTYCCHSWTDQIVTSSSISQCDASLFVVRVACHLVRRFYARLR